MVFILYFSKLYSGIELYYEARCIQLMTIGPGMYTYKLMMVDNLMVEGNEEEETGSLYIFWEGNRGLAKMWLRK